MVARLRLILLRIRLFLSRQPFTTLLIINLLLGYLSAKLVQVVSHRVSSRHHQSTTHETKKNRGSAKRTTEEFRKAYKELTQRVPKNSTQRVAFVTFSYVQPHNTEKLFNFLLPAVETWAAPVPGEEGHRKVSSEDTGAEYNTMLYVVLSHESRDAYEQNCLDEVLCNRIHPIYVDCPEGYYGDSPCCKQQKGLLQLYEGKDYPLYDWYAYFDDDIYLRKEYVVQNLQLFEQPNFPMAMIPRSNDAKFLGHMEYTCSTERGPNFQYPYGMPIFYSLGAIRMLSKGFRANSLVNQCRAYHVTHDVGNQILNWMYSLPVAKLPPMATVPKMRADYIGNHWVGRDDMEKNYHLQPRDASRPKLEPLPKGSFSFKKTHEKWLSAELKAPDLQKLFALPENRWYKNVTGYRQTLTYARYREPTSWEEGVWHTMEVSDCYPERKKEQQP